VKTKITQLLGIKYPVIMAAMAWIGDVKWILEKESKNEATHPTI
jgi:NAD(P)H-dependent flavin oxidoreductase YrpB (nitropropane dioxygenase family)